MKLGGTYSHLNGEEFLLVHHPELLEEINGVIQSIDAEAHKTKISKEKTMTGKALYSPVSMNNDFKERFRKLGWEEARYQHCVTVVPEYVKETEALDLAKQKETLQSHGIETPLTSYKQVDFVKNDVAIEVQFGKYPFVAYDIFVKHLLFYSGRVINVGVEILPMKSLQSQMSSGVGYYEGEVYNVIRHGRTSPPVPLFIIGIEPDPT